MECPVNMIIGIDASRANKKEKTGVEWYAWHVIEELKKIIPEDHRVILYSDEPIIGALALLPKHWESRILHWPPKRLWTQVRLSREMFQHPPDVLFVPAHVFPIIHQKKTMMMVHDVAAATFPESYPWFERWYSLWSARFAARNLWKVIVPSQFTKDQLIKLSANSYELSAIIVIPHGVDSRYRKIHDRAAIDAVLNKYAIRRPFLLSVGRVEEKKNTANIVRVFDRLHGKVQGSGFGGELVLIGNPGHGYEKVKEAIAQSPWKRDIRVLGWVETEDIVFFMNAAEAFIFPSLYEGFGMPILEAFACGTPVIAGKGSSLREVGESGAVYVDANNPNEIVEVIFRLRNEIGLRDSLIQNGFSRVKHFSWGEAAQKTKDALLSP